MVNYYILLYLVVTVACMAALAYVTARQFKEVRRPQNQFTRLRWRLFWLPTILLIGLVIGLPRLVTNLHAQYQAGQIVRIVGGIIVLLAITGLILSIYTYRERQ